jgi:hypothetical protein
MKESVKFFGNVECLRVETDASDINYCHVPLTFLFIREGQSEYARDQRPPSGCVEYYKRLVRQAVAGKLRRLNWTHDGIFGSFIVPNEDEAEHTSYGTLPILHVYG